MRGRKFNLGEILRKLNEEKKPEPAQLPHESPTTDSAAGEGRASRPLSSGLPYSGESPPPLPEQPHLSQPRPDATSMMRDNHRESLSTGSGSYRVSSGENGPVHRSGYEEKTAVAEPGLSETVFFPDRPYERARNYSGEESEEPAYDFYRMIGILLRRKYAILLIGALSAFVSIVRYMKADTYFDANARLLFQPETQGIVDEQRVFRYWGDREKVFATHLELLTSHSVLSIAADNYGNEITPEMIKSSLTIRQGETGGEKNDIIELSFRHREAETARDVVNEICKSYIDYRRTVNAQEITRLVGKFEFQIGKIQGDLSKKESALREFKESNRMVELSRETNLTITKLADMEMSLQATQLALLENRERLAALNNQIGNQEQNIVQSVTYQDPFQNRIADLELELNTLSTEYSPEHFKVKMLRQQIENLKSATADSITREAASRTLVKNPIRQMLVQDLVNLTVEKSALDAKRTAQEQIIERLNQELVLLPAMEQKYAYLQRETESLLQTLLMLKAKYEEAKIRRDSEESDLKVLELARTPVRELTSVKPVSIIIGLLIGIVLGIGLAFLLEYLDQTLKEPSAVEQALGLPLLGIVPFIEADHALLENGTDLTKNILEPFRALRANLKHIAAARNLKTFIVCSAVKGEGKTTLAANLGITFALDGKKVLLIDGDLRRSQAHTLFSVPKEKGLADYLVGTVKIDDIVKPTRFDNLFVVTSGERPHNPAELLGTIRFDMMIREARAKADIVIFDSPALLPVSDAITMAPKIDSVLFVVRTSWTPTKAAQQALNQLQRIGSRLHGGILNGASPSGKYYPYYYGYYGYYGYDSYKYSYEGDSPNRFSVRQAGLTIEKKVRDTLSTTKFSIPKYATAASRNLRRMARRKFLWLLLCVLCILTGARIAVRSLRQDTLSGESVVYLGLMPNGARDTIPNGRDIAFPGAGEVNGIQTREVVSSAEFQTPDLDKNVKGWFKAFSERSREPFLAYYDTASFRFDGGGYDRWQELTGRELWGSERDAMTVLDTMKRLGTDSLRARVMIDFHFITSEDTIPGKIGHTWSLGSGGWRIVEEKRIFTGGEGNGAD